MQIWRYMLILIAIVTHGALATMNLLGGFEAFSDPRLQYSASAVGAVSDVGVPVFLFGMGIFYKRRDWFLFSLAAVFWASFSAYTVAQGATWLEHTFAVTQKPAEQRKLTEQKKQEKLKAEQANLDKANEVALTTKSKEIRENALKLADAARARIAALEALNTFEAAAVPEPVKSPLTGYELFVAFVLWAASQGCWHMAFAAEAGEATEASGEAKSEALPLRQPKQKGEAKRGAASPEAGEAQSEAESEAQRCGKRGGASVKQVRQSLKLKENFDCLTPRQDGVVVPLRPAAKPNPSEVKAMTQRGMSQRKIAEAFGVSQRTIGRIVRKGEAHAAQMA